MNDEHPHWGRIPDDTPDRLTGTVKPRRATPEQVHAWADAIRKALGWVKGEPRKKDTTDAAR